MASSEGASPLVQSGTDFTESLSSEEVRPRCRKVAGDVLSLALPNIAGYLLTLINELTNTIFIGQSGDEAQLAAIGLGNMMQNCIGLSIGIGIASGLDTFVSQAHGAGQRRLCAHYLQRSRVCVTLQLVWMVPALWFSHQILQAIGQDANVAAYAGEYNRASVWGLFFWFQFESVRRFLTNQGMTKVPMWILGITSCLHFVWCSYFVLHLKWGNSGVGYANTITWTLSCLLSSLYLYIKAPEMGFQRREVLIVQTEGLRGLGPYMRVALPATVQLCSEWWFWEICALVVGYLGEVSLAAHVSTGNVLGVCFMPIIGIQISAATLVGNMLGANKPKMAQVYCWVCTAFAVFVWCFMASALFFGAPLIASVYTNKDDVRDAMLPLLHIFAGAGFFDSTQNVEGGVLRGMGYQRSAAAVYLICFFGVMLPLGIFLGFQRSWLTMLPHNWGVQGIWWSFFVGTGLALTIFSTILSRVRWVDLAAESAARLQREARTVQEVSPEASKSTA